MTNRFLRVCVALLAVGISLSAFSAEPEIAVRGLMKNSAVLEINGKQHLLKAGKVSPEGVKLVSANSKEAVIEVNGVQRTLEMGRQIGGQYTDAGPKELRIPQGNNGHYYVRGLVNGRSADFVVDTGASSIAMSEVEAKRLGLIYLNAPRIEVSTASSSDLAYRVNLTSVTLGSITLYNVESVILPGEYPQIILLGNSFLSKVNMQVDSGVLLLEAKF